jgi:hypothetical protein
LVVSPLAPNDDRLPSGNSAGLTGLPRGKPQLTDAQAIETSRTLLPGQEMWVLSLKGEGWDEGEGSSGATQDLRVRFDAWRTSGALWL